MEDVLYEYVQPYDPKWPRVCVDEGNMQFTSNRHESLEMKPGKVKKEDYHYDHEGYCSIFLACEPLSGRRVVHVEERRTKIEFAHFLRYLVNEEYPEAEKIVMIMDNLNTHLLSSLYKAFPAEEARRLARKVEIHHTPTNGSWLNMAEIELSVLGRQVLKERLADIESVRQKIAVWEARRNTEVAKINWRFTAEDARIKLKRLYPIIEACSLTEKEHNED